MIKVLHLIDSDGLGGAQTVVKSILETEKPGVTSIACSLRNKAVEIEFNSDNVLTPLSSSKYSLSPIWKVKKIIRENDINVLHCHLYKSQVIGWIVKTLWFPKVKLVQHEHGQVLIKDKIYSLFLKLSQGKTNSFIAVSELIKNELSKKGVNQSKIRVIYNPLNLKIFSVNMLMNEENTFFNRFNIEEDKFIIGFAGRLVERKGWREFVNAAILIHKTCPNIHFLIAGDGLERDVLLKQVEKKKYITYIGRVSSMKYFYATLDCFVAPPHWEAVGLTQLEAQAMGVPVIASNIEGLREVVNDGVDCLLFKKRDSFDLAKKMQMIIESPALRKKMIEEGKENVKKYDLEEYVHNLEKVYE